jgi:hypothetical protein
MRSINDLQALALRELSGAERRGTVVAELTGSAIPEAADDAVSALLKPQPRNTRRLQTGRPQPKPMRKPILRGRARNMNCS